MKATDCPNGPDEYGHYPCDPKVYGGIAECRVCGRIARWLALSPKGISDSLGWHVISGEQLLETLRRAQAGEDAGLLFAELWANAEHEYIEGTDA